MLNIHDATGFELHIFIMSVLTMILGMGHNCLPMKKLKLKQMTAPSTSEKAASSSEAGSSLYTQNPGPPAWTERMGGTGPRPRNGHLTTSTGNPYTDKSTQRKP